jgi:hypothetical protein
MPNCITVRDPGLTVEERDFLLKAREIGEVKEEAEAALLAEAKRLRTLAESAAAKPASDFSTKADCALAGALVNS